VSTATTLSPSRLKVLWERLAAATDEAGTALRRSAFSNVIRESRDFSYSLFDRSGRPLAQSSESIPSFLGTLPLTMRHLLERFPVEAWGPGDVAMTNDPWLGTGHLPDVCIARPVFHAGEVVGFAGAVGHVSDIGGMGLSASARELHQEGLVIPPVWAYRADEPLSIVTDVIAANVRVPTEVLGDIEALVAGCRVLDRRVRHTLEDAPDCDLVTVATALNERSEDAMREAIEALPLEGAVEHELVMDGQGEPLPIRVRVEKRGTDLVLDFSGSAHQVPYGVNSVLAYTRAYSLYALKCALAPQLPNNDGTFAPVSVIAEEGSVLNPAPPAAVGGRNMTGHFVALAVLGALAKVVPERVLAESGAPRPVLSMRGVRENGERFSTVFFLMGGMGATPVSDGHSVTAFPTNTSFTPVEVIEQTNPVRVLTKRLRPDSGGAGQHRGGLGQVIEIQLLGSVPAEVSLIGNRADNPPSGLVGGGPGAACRAFVNGEQVGLMDTRRLRPGDVVRVETPGGGGYGDPSLRSPAANERDLRRGYVTRPSDTTSRQEEDDDKRSST
jgi:N-methylhydantoinase B